MNTLINQTQIQTNLILAFIIIVFVSICVIIIYQNSKAKSLALKYSRRYNYLKQVNSKITVSNSKFQIVYNSAFDFDNAANSDNANIINIFSHYIYNNKNEYSKYLKLKQQYDTYISYLDNAPKYIDVSEFKKSFKNDNVSYYKYSKYEKIICDDALFNKARFAPICVIQFEYRHEEYQIALDSITENINKIICCKYVKQYSKRLRYTVALNKKITFNHGQKRIEKCCNSLQQFRNFDFNKKMKEYLDKNRELAESCRNYLLYQDKLRRLPQSISISEFSNLHIHDVSFEFFSSCEKSLCDKYFNKLDAPFFIYHISYNSPGGRNHYRNTKSFNVSTILQLYKEIYNDSLKKTKRKRTVTAGQRQRILRRDNFTCQLCGAKGPGAGGTVELQVDHKIPFSKGGSDDDSNPWTLCKACNLGKSSKYID